MKRSLSFLFLVLLCLIFTSKTSYADGILIPDRPTFYINETDQKAVIWHDGKTQTMILSVSFSGNAEKFAWVVPVPAKPEVSQGYDELFTGLTQLTRPNTRYDMLPAAGGSFGALNESKAPSVTVVETKKVDIYDIAVLTAQDSTALRKWLEDNGFEYPENKEHLLNSYVNKDWYFVAAKVSPDALGIAGGLRTGHATPLKLSFASEKIVYPLKISGKAAETVNTESKLIGAFSFEDGTAEGWSGSILPNEDAFNGSNVLTAYGNTFYGDTRSRSNDLSRTINGFKTGRQYVFSAYVKPGSNTGKGYVHINTGMNSSDTLEVSSFTTWKRLVVSFTAKSTSSTFSLNTNSEVDLQIYWDAIMIEEGTVPSEFGEEKIPQIYNPQNRATEDVYTQLMIYVFADHKQEVPGWNVEYAGKVSSKTIEKLAYDDNGDPWMKSPKKMYLTKLTRNMRQSEMTSDVYFRDAANDATVGVGNSGIDSLIGNLSWRLLLVFGVPLITEMVIIVYIWKRRYKN